MYETGTNVLLNAGNNPILSFSNWSSGETNAELSVPMTSDKHVTAVYSSIDYIAGWDFYNAGSNGRSADFASNDDNQASVLNLRNAAGTTSGWLDKSFAFGGYEGANAAVNWKPIADKYYYQIVFNAADFTNISVFSSMLFNYNAYSVQQIEYSIDGENFVKLDEIQMSSAKVWYPKTVNIPANANHQSKVYVRWIPDYSSAIVGASSSNDGTAISSIYVFGTPAIINDGIPPVLVSSVPANNGTNASTTGKIVLNFDERIQIADGAMATLGNKSLQPEVVGNTVTFAYTGLDYNSQFSFILPANVISDLGGNTISTPISISFTTINRPTVAKKLFDFVVGVDGDFKAALQAAQAAAGSGNRFYVFFPNGEYNIGENTGDGNQMTTISTPRLSIIGQSKDHVTIYNKSITESINTTATVYFTGTSSNNYLQDVALMNKMDFRTGTLLGRAVALWDQGNKNIYKNVRLLSNQDTYFTGGSIRSYHENSEIHGTVDFICGGGDIFFNECLLYLEQRSGNVIVAPATTTNWGYVFNNSTIDGFPINNNGYRLGRPWSNAPKTVFINTTMKVLPVSAGWGDPMNVVPAVFAEYNSKTAGGALIDLSGRRTTYTKDATTVTLNPVLSQAEAATYTVENVLGGTDSWQPQLYTDQAAAPLIAGNGHTINWDDNNYVLCWAVFKDDVFVQFTTSNNYTIPQETPANTIFTVRAANEMGGLSPSSNSFAFGVTSLSNPDTVSELVSQMYFTPEGKRIQSLEGFKGLVIIRSVYADGSVIARKAILTKD